jgi:hypothetical protein
MYGDQTRFRYPKNPFIHLPTPIGSTLPIHDGARGLKKLTRLDRDINSYPMFRLLSILVVLSSAYAVTPTSNYTLQTINATTESIIVVPVVISLAVAVAFTIILSYVLCRYYNKQVKATDHDYQTVYNM